MGTLGRVVFSLGKAARSTGQALDRLGSRLQGGYVFKDEGKASGSSYCGLEIGIARVRGVCFNTFFSLGSNLFILTHDPVSFFDFAKIG